MLISSKTILDMVFLYFCSQVETFVRITIHVTMYIYILPHTRGYTYSSKKMSSVYITYLVATTSKQCIYINICTKGQRGKMKGSECP